MEVRKEVPNVQAINGGLTSIGILRLTDYHIVFCAPPPPEKDSSSPPSTESPKIRESWIPYPILSQCHLRPTHPSSGVPSTIRIRCRDFTFVTFTFEEDKVAREVFEHIKSRTYRLGSVHKLYAFKHVPLKAEKEVDGWAIYDPRAEYRRQGVGEKSADKGWRISTINKDYTFCDSYPALLAVPSKISDNVLKYARDFRSKNRIPVLTYLHPVNNCTITRSSQPLSGPWRKTSRQDENLVAASFLAPLTGLPSEDSTPNNSQDGSQDVATNAVEEELVSAAAAAAAAAAEEKTSRIFGAQKCNMIVDARPTVNAFVNQMQGYGSEKMENYPFADKTYLNIGNIHVMRDSLNSVVELIKDADVSSLSLHPELLATHNWLRHVRDVLKGADMITRHVGIKSSHVLIHCSDGWDRTSQLSALSQIMLDPYYRTMEGFIVLVEKDWLSFGHMFRLRCGHLNHESWFSVHHDAMAGVTVQPGEGDGRNDAFQNAFASARRLFNRGEQLDVDAMAAEAAPGRIADKEATDPKMVSPIFHQFLDCVYQLQRQHPNRFEFTERFLRRLLYHLYSCQYGTFLYNSEKQRLDASVAERTSSVWDYFLTRKADFTNADYDAVVNDHVKGRERILLPHLDKLRWWFQLFNRSDYEMNSALDAQETLRKERQAARSSMQAPSSTPGQAETPPTSPSPKPPASLSTSQSDLGDNGPSSSNFMPLEMTPSLQRSVSNDEMFSDGRGNKAGS